MSPNMTIENRGTSARRFGATLAAAALAAALGAGIPQGVALGQPAKPAPAASPAPQDPFAALLPQETELAKSEEQAGNIRSAAYHWDMVANLATGNAKSQAQAKAAALRKDAKSRADALFKDGMAAYEKNQIAPAFKNLLRGLAYDPTNQVALRKIKDELIGTSVVPYTVAKDDTLAAIAQKNKYEDPALAWVIGVYNDLGENPKFKPGQAIKVPVMIGVLPRAGAVARRGGAGGSPAEEEGEIDSGRDTLNQARELIKSNKFDEASKLAAKVLADDPVNKDAKEVANSSNYGLGKQLQEQKKYEAALTAFSRVDPTYRDTKQMMTAVRGQVLEGAEEHYSAGVNYFTHDDLDNAIKEFETTLMLNPNHPQAAKDLKEARDTRDKLRNIK